jgi:hypothetical protein
VEALGALCMFAAYAAFIVYVWTLQWVLRTCAPENRTMSPSLVWLQVVPLFGTIWQFFVVRAIGTSLAGEYASRAVPRRGDAGDNLGLTKAIVDAVALTCVMGAFILGWAYADHPEGTLNSSDYAYAGLVTAAGYVFLLSFVLSIIYWIATYKSAWRLRSLPQPGLGPQTGLVRFCYRCGGFTEGDTYCRRCGANQERRETTETA